MLLKHSSIQTARNMTHHQEGKKIDIAQKPKLNAIVTSRRFKKNLFFQSRITFSVNITSRRAV